MVPKSKSPVLSSSLLYLNNVYYIIHIFCRLFFCVFFPISTHFFKKSYHYIILQCYIFFGYFTMYYYYCIHFYLIMWFFFGLKMLFFTYSFPSIFLLFYNYFLFIIVFFAVVWCIFFSHLFLVIKMFFLESVFIFKSYKNLNFEPDRLLKSYN